MLACQAKSFLPRESVHRLDVVRVSVAKSESTTISHSAALILPNGGVILSW